MAVGVLQLQGDLHIFLQRSLGPPVERKAERLAGRDGLRLVGYLFQRQADVGIGAVQVASRGLGRQWW